MLKIEFLFFQDSCKLKKLLFPFHSRVIQLFIKLEFQYFLYNNKSSTKMLQFQFPFEWYLLNECFIVELWKL